MTSNQGSEEKPAGTKEEMMRATYRALQEHGYADLTIQKIGDEFSKSKSLVYHHYDGKDELLLDFLEHILERFESDVIGDESDEADARLEQILDHILPDSPDDDRLGFLRIMIEIRAQAAHDEAYREHFTRSDQLFQDRFASLIRDGIDQGVFRPVDADRVASFLLTAISGAMQRQATANDEAVVTATRRELDAYIETRIHPDGG